MFEIDTWCCEFYDCEKIKSLIGVKIFCLFSSTWHKADWLKKVLFYLDKNGVEIVGFYPFWILICSRIRLGMIFVFLWSLGKFFKSTGFLNVLDNEKMAAEKLIAFCLKSENMKNICEGLVSEGNGIYISWKKKFCEHCVCDYQFEMWSWSDLFNQYFSIVKPGFYIKVPIVSPKTIKWLPISTVTHFSH